jgi:hypothetical protein
MRELAWILAATSLLGACTTRSHAPDDDAGEVPPDATAAPDAPGEDDAGARCGCAPGIHDDHVLVISDDAELWAFDPRDASFERVRGSLCETAESPFSMAIDAQGRAYVMFVESRAIRSFDLADPSASCAGSGIDASAAGIGLAGMTFVREPATLCESMYLHSYSGDGAFDEGPGAGTLGLVDPSSRAVTALATIDYDGGELAGTGDGRLFAIAGVRPAKIVEYARDTGVVIETLPLDGFSKTNASAMAFFGGDLWLFTEALPLACETCLEASCDAERDACEADPTCAPELACLLETAEPNDTCGGGLPEPLLTCVTATCSAGCGVRPGARTSQVTRLDWDGDRSRTVVVREGPIRVVGAGTSTCVQTTPF